MYFSHTDTSFLSAFFGKIRAPKLLYPNQPRTTKQFVQPAFKQVSISSFPIENSHDGRDVSNQYSIQWTVFHRFFFNMVNMILCEMVMQILHPRSKPQVQSIGTLHLQWTNLSQGGLNWSLPKLFNSMRPIMSCTPVVWVTIAFHHWSYGSFNIVFSSLMCYIKWRHEHWREYGRFCDSSMEGRKSMPFIMEVLFVKHGQIVRLNYS